jgi:hypothetical protein
MNSFLKFALFISISFALFSGCNNESPVNIKQKNDSIHPLKSNNITPNVKIFFKSFDGIDEEGNEYKSISQERIPFSKEKKYTFCYDSEAFEHIWIQATGENFTIIVKNSESAVFTKENVKINKEICFTNKDFDFNIGVSYQIIIKQNNTVVFEGTIDSQGCM